MNPIIVDDRYEFVQEVPSLGDVMIALESIHLDKNQSMETEVFLAKAVSCNIEVEVQQKKPGDLVSLPSSVYGKTTVNYAGRAPRIILNTDKFGNLQVFLSPQSVVEVIFNREIPGAHGRNKGAHAKKIVYRVQ